MLSILSAVVWVDFFTILLSKYVPMGHSLNKWYSEFGAFAIVSDCLVIVLGILLAKMIFPNATGWNLVLFAVLIQIVHDILFYVLVVTPMPTGTNKMIDLFKEYGAENGWKILPYDSFMIASTVLLADAFEEHGLQEQGFAGLLGVYAMTYVTFTKNL